MTPRFFDAASPGFLVDFREFLDARRSGAGVDADDVAREIVARVRAEGGAAVAAYTQRLDGVVLSPDTLQGETLNLRSAADACPEDLRLAIDFAADRIERYHHRQTPPDQSWTDESGVRLGWRWSPIDSVGLYVPGGRAAYASSVLMNALPARAAGVRRLVLVSPATSGVLSPAIAYAARRVGVDEYYPIGGAQAVAALAFGAGSLAPVDKVVGPGNAYVTAAKRLVLGRIGIDSLAGPSEITVIADDSVDPVWAAADLLSQCEHDPAAQAILITDSDVHSRAVCAALDALLAKLSSRTTAEASWRTHGAVVIAERRSAADVVNLIAPEHVEILAREPEEISAGIRHAGAIFIGPWSAEVLGDYVTGSNHVLPTSGSARFSSGLSVYDFLKRTSLQSVPHAAFDRLADAAERLADAEGLPAHGLAVRVRRGRT